MGSLWKPLALAWPLFALSLMVLIVQVTRCALGPSFNSGLLSPMEQWKRRALIAFLHLLQPLARLVGRMRHGLTFWRRRAETGYAFPRRRLADIWTLAGQSIEQ